MAFFWVDLSDDELADRLKQRGLDSFLAENWVYHRETEGGAELITEYLGGNG
jgi:hypothetical protein